MKSHRIAIVLFLFLFALVPFTAPAGAAQNLGLDRLPTVGVATYNVYIGTDVFAVLSGANTLEKAVAEIIALNFPERAEAIVRALVKSSPDLIGFQEAWHIQINMPQMQLNWNYKEILAALLEPYGYTEVVASDLSDIMVPLDPANPAYYARVTDHDAIFAKKALPASEIESMLYTDTFKAQLAGQTIVSKRGWVSAVFNIKGHPYRFVNTHLEVDQVPAISPTGEVLGIAQDLQAQELADHLAAETRPLILVGDFNAQPGTQPTTIVENSGFADMWSLRILGRQDPGYTCCQAPNLLNQQSILDQRIDYIYARNDKGELPCNVSFPLLINVIGDRKVDKTRTLVRLWPSDHGGLQATLIIPPLNGGD